MIVANKVVCLPSMPEALGAVPSTRNRVPVALRRWRQENQEFQVILALCEFKDSLGYLRHYL